MKRTALTRSGQLTRKTRMPRRRATPRRSGRARDAGYMERVRGLPCAAAIFGSFMYPCHGPIEADHAGQRPAGRKADDDTCIPLCQAHHRQRTDGNGIFWMFTKESQRAWLDHHIKKTRDALGWTKAA